MRGPGEEILLGAALGLFDADSPAGDADAAAVRFGEFEVTR
jgi:hypothetical protein